MHDACFTGDGATALFALTDEYEARLAADSQPTPRISPDS
jgi:hypothetical protein